MFVISNKDLIIIGELHQDLRYETEFFEDLSKIIAQQLHTFINYNPDDLRKPLIEKIIKKAIANIPKKIIADCNLKRGGNGNNTAEFCAKLGLSTTLITVIGKYSDWMIDELNSLGVNTDLIFKNELLTPVSTIIESPFTTKIFIAQNLKEKMNFEGANLDPNIFNHFKLLYITPIAQKFKKILNISKTYELIRCVNIESQKVKNFEYLEALIEDQIDILLMNKGDANLILDEKLSLNELDNYFKKFASIRLYTAGGEGSYLYTDNFELSCPTIQLKFVKDRTGAGDCYAAGFLIKLSELIKDKSELKKLLENQSSDQVKGIFMKCMKYGTYTALYKISTQLIPKKEDIEEFIEKINFK